MVTYFLQWLRECRDIPVLKWHFLVLYDLIPKICSQQYSFIITFKSVFWNPCFWKKDYIILSCTKLKKSLSEIFFEIPFTFKDNIRMFAIDEFSWKIYLCTDCFPWHASSSCDTPPPWWVTVTLYGHHGTVPASARRFRGRYFLGQFLFPVRATFAEPFPLSGSC